MKKNNEFFDRILQLIEHKGFKSVNDFALNGLGYKASEKINRLKDATNRPSVEIILDITNKFEDVNPKWLIAGKGNMLLEDTTNPSSGGKIIRFWSDIEATGGGLVSFDDGINNGYSEMILPNFIDCTDAIAIYGDSMAPKYKSGQIVVLKPWQESYIEYGQAYLIVTRNSYRMIKYLFPSQDKQNITCVSEDKVNYPAFDIGKDDIHRLYIVKGVVEQHIF